MQEKDREKLHFFRYGLIAPILNGQVESKRDYLAEICSQGSSGPYRGDREYKPKTIEKWLKIYEKEGFDGLKPKSLTPIKARPAASLRSLKDPFWNCESKEETFPSPCSTNY